METKSRQRLEGIRALSDEDVYFGVTNTGTSTVSSKVPIPTSTFTSSQWGRGRSIGFSCCEIGFERILTNEIYTPTLNENWHARNDGMCRTMLMQSQK